MAGRATLESKQSALGPSGFYTLCFHIFLFHGERKVLSVLATFERQRTGVLMNRVHNHPLNLRGNKELLVLLSHRRVHFG